MAARCSGALDRGGSPVLVVNGIPVVLALHSNPGGGLWPDRSGGRGCGGGRGAAGPCRGGALRPAQHPEWNRHGRRWFSRTALRTCLGPAVPIRRRAAGLLDIRDSAGAAAADRAVRGEPGWAGVLRLPAAATAGATAPLAQGEGGGRGAQQGSAGSPGGEPDPKRQSRRTAGQHPHRHQRARVENSDHQHRQQGSQQRQQQQAAQEGQGRNGTWMKGNQGVSRGGQQRRCRGRGRPSDAASPAPAPGCRTPGSPESPPSPRALWACDTRPVPVGRCGRRPRPGR